MSRRRQGGSGAALLVHAANLDGATRRGLEVYFEGPCRGRFSFGPAEEADLGLIDLDAVRDPADLDRYRTAHPDRPVVALATPPAAVADAGVVVVDKPLQPATLRRLLDRAAEDRAAEDRDAEVPVDEVPAAVVAAAVVSADDDPPGEGQVAEVSVGEERAVPARPAEPAPRPSVPRRDDAEVAALLGAAGRYDPDEYLEGAVRRACRQARHGLETVEVALRGARLVVGPGDHGVEMHCSPTQVRLACSRPGQVAVRRLRTPRAVGAVALVQAERLLWDVALWCSQGRLAVGVDPAAPTRLRHWPDLPRCSAPPGAVAVCARWGAGPASINDLLAEGHQPATVLGLHAALTACDLLDATGDPGDLLPAPPARRGFLRRLLGHLRTA